MTTANAYCRIPVKLILKLGDKFGYDAYLKLSDSKIIKISHSNEPIKDAIVRYHETKGVQDIYVTKEDYLKIIDGFKAQLTHKLFDPETTAEDKVDIIEKCYSMIKESLVSIGFNQDTIDMAKKISESSTRLVKESQNVFTLLKKFSENCEEELKKSLIIGYLCSGMIETFDWGTETIKEKCSLAALLCAVLLNSAQIKEIQILSQSLPLKPESLEKINNHPQNVVQALANEDWISKESLVMIEQHHEEQSGKGFPMGLPHTRISQLSAIFIVAMRFSDLLFENNFNFREKDKMLGALRRKYNLGVFKKATLSLIEIIGTNES